MPWFISRFFIGDEMPLNSLEVPRKFLIRTRRGPLGQLAAFPLLHGLNERFPESELIVISDKNEAPFFSILPFKVNCLERPTQIQSLAALHKWSYQQKDIFNIDVFFDLESTLTSSWIGFTFRAKERWGKNGGIKSYFLNKKINENLGQRALDAFSTDLLCAFLQNKQRPASLVNPLKGSGGNDFVVAFVSDLTKEKFTWWREAISHFPPGLIRLCPDDEAWANGASELALETGVVCLGPIGVSGLPSLLAQAKGVLTDTSWIAWLSTYLGIPALVFGGKAREAVLFESWAIVPDFVFSEVAATEVVELVHRSFDL
jgi:hypothetical protein